MSTNTNVDKRCTGEIGAMMPVIAPLPIEVVGSDGNHLITADGKRLLDFWSDEGVSSLGYGHSIVQQELRKFAESGYPVHCPQMFPNKVRNHVTKLITQAVGFETIFFGNSGAEANEAAIKLARRAKFNAGDGRRKIYTVTGNFHGRTGFALAASDSTDSPYHLWGYDPIPKGFGVADTPGDVDWEECAAVIMAPILGNNCIKTYPKEQIQAWRDACDEHGAFLIFDEIQVGMGRTGYAAAWQGIGVKPDIVTFGKGIAAGVPMGACCADGWAKDVFTPGVHFSTFGGNILALHMASVVLAYIEAHAQRIKDDGEHVRNRLSELEWIKHVDGAGIHNAFQVNFDVVGYDGYDFIHEARNHGILLCSHRRHGPIRFTPPLTITRDEINTAIGALVATHVSLTQGE